jgi:hypothetical protein
MTRLPKPDRYAKRERVDYTGLALPKDPPVGDARFKEFARSLGCQIRGRRDAKNGARHVCLRIGGRVPMEFAHYRTAGKGLKGSDRGNGMGLCHEMHRLQHDMGWPRFAKRFDFDPLDVCSEVAAAFDRRFPEKKGEGSR